MADNKWQEYLEKQARLLDQGIITQEDYNNAVKDAKVQIIGYTASLKASNQQLGMSMFSLGTALAKGEKGASVYNNSINSLADAFASLVSMIPFVGKLLGGAVKAGAKYVTAVNEQSDALFETYQDLTRSGLATGMQDIFDSMSSMGHTVKELGEMSAMLKENSQVLANFGGTAANGVKQFTDIAGSIQSSEIAQEFKRMGMSIGNINKGIAGYMRIQQTSGVLQNQTNEQLARSAADYIEQQDKLTKLTGIASDLQNQIVLNALAEQRYAATQAELKGDGTEKSAQLAKRNDELLIMFTGQFGSKTARAFQDYASGMMNSDDAQKFQRSFPDAAKMIREGTGTVADITQAASVNAQEVRDSYASLAKGGVANDRLTDYAEVVKGSGANLQQTAQEKEAAAKKEQKEQKEGKDKGVAQMVDLTTAQRNQTQAFQKLVNKGIGPVTKGLSTVTEGITKVTGVVGSVAGRKDQMGAGADAKNANAESLLKFAGGNTGSKSNFDALSTRVKEAFLAMVGEYGSPVTINSAKRGTDDQERLYNAWLEAGGSPQNPIVNTKYGRVKMPAKPGTSPHEKGNAIDLDDSSFAGLSGLFGKYGFNTVKGDPGHIQMAKGGVVSGPTGGYNATLHGTEAVVPMNNEQTIPVESEDTGDKQQLELLSKKIMTLDNIINSAKRNISVTEQILKKQH
jgi:hypothetical protein